ncbi:MAG TPA: YggS family pyridoxal phosphate-dependent enzyme [Bacteroidota bacterium]|nr:YggS family pyridoxal phosphate-dependent enzyme [Bacteroidota bacterium]
MIVENFKEIQERVNQACSRVQRKREEITVLAVTKSFSIDVIREALVLGIYDFGENFVQELRNKRENLQSEKIRWHFIGHLQSNKVKFIVPWIHLIHSVDSMNLAQEISTRANQIGRKIDVLLEVNATGEKSKYGMSPNEVPTFIKSLSHLSNINVQGLMTMGPLSPDPEESRSSFRILRRLKDDLYRDGIPLQHLSMGMTNDFEVAIEEGATIVRIGTALFGKRSKVKQPILNGRPQP